MVEKLQGRVAILAQIVVTADHMDRHKHDVLHHPAGILDHLGKGTHVTLACDRQRLLSPADRLREKQGVV